MARLKRSKYTGPDLRERRRSLGIKGKDVAAAMGATSQYVSQVETRTRLTERAVNRYQDALDTALVERLRAAATDPETIVHLFPKSA